MAGKFANFKVERFDGRGSFTLWQSRVKDILIQQGLDIALNGKDGKPEKMAVEDWANIESRCVSTIRLCIEDNIINNVMDENSAPKLWEKLERLYLGKGLTTKLNLKRELYRLKMEEGGNLMEHMNVFNGLVDQLAKVGVKIEEEDKALLLLTSLPDSYENLVTTVLYGKDTVDMVAVESILLSHDKRRKPNGGGDENSAFVVRGRNRRGRKTVGESSSDSRSNSKDSGKGPKCYKCGDWGHIKRNCPTWDNRKGGGGGSNSLAVAEEYEHLGDVLTVSKRHTSSQEEWILDSGASNHACFKKKYFDTFQEIKTGSVSLPNGHRCAVIGVGTVKIKMFDGAVHVLGGVMYIPKLQRNLISMSRLDSKGCKCTIAGGAMKITRGGKVLLKGEECEGLYCLVGSTVTSAQTSRSGWKRSAQEIKALRRVSVAGAKTRVTCFQVSDGGEKVNPAGEEASKSFFGVDG